MGRPRKPLEMQTGNLTRETQEKRKYEESLVNTGKTDLDDVPANLFLDAVARKEYKRVLADLKKIDIIGNLDRANLISYANSYALYVKTCKKMKAKGFEDIVLTAQGMKPNPLYMILDQTKREMEAAGKALGMSATARLQIASAKAKDQEEDLKDTFGDI